MIKSAKNGNLDKLISKILVLPLWIFLVELRILLFFSLCLFSSHVTRKSSQEKSAYRLWIMILNFWWLYALLYIIWKRTLCRTQTYASYENSIIVVDVTVIFHCWCSKSPFATKCTVSALVMHHKRVNEFIIQKNRFSP